MIAAVTGYQSPIPIVTSANTAPIEMATMRAVRWFRTLNSALSLLKSVTSRRFLTVLSRSPTLAVLIFND